MASSRAVRALMVGAVSLVAVVALLVAVAFAPSGPSGFTDRISVRAVTAGDLSHETCLILSTSAYLERGYASGCAALSAEVWCLGQVGPVPQGLTDKLSVVCWDPPLDACVARGPVPYVARPYECGLLRGLLKCANVSVVTDACSPTRE